ncbi:S66 family peptidase [Paenibacillus agricola]|uniref:LD-carboxypeptidase n=1 Tax=Paenibacillus agricola TaxID=2716264 RepID=A0ABX0JC80_9BACL|nr:S66 peptidase family protein [Paenibacillus agricola]NHN33381.1 LD-carboxypeptidase [Paenibacillus agricola]
MSSLFLKPKRLLRGDTIGVISPSSPVASFYPNRLKRGLHALDNMGFKVIVGQHAAQRTGHTAGSIKDRLEDFHNMIRNPDVKAIIATIGGYNSHQLLEELDYPLISENPKIIMGYSDITALLAGIHAKTNLITFMGPAIMPQFGEYGGLMEFTKKSLEKTLMSDQPIGMMNASIEWIEEHLKWDIEDTRPRETKLNPGIKVLKPGQAEGPILAANMGTLLLLSGTPYLPDFEGRILCLEDDESEQPSTIDRYLTQFRQMGIFEQISALLIGRFHPKVGFNQEDSLQELLKSVTRGYHFPVLYDADFGHTDPMMVLPNGVHARLHAVHEQHIHFSIEEAAVQ